MAAFFQTLGERISVFFSVIFSAFAGIRFADILDIAILAFVVYKALEFFRETRAKPLIKGIIILAFFWVIATWWNMVSVKWLMAKIFDYAIIAIAIIFQPELRRALERMGRSNLGLFDRSGSNAEEIDECINRVSAAAVNMQERKIGALIVFERNTPLGEIIDTGTVVNAEVATPLIGNIFFPNSPLHDGAMIIRGNRIYAAGCILPLTAREDLSEQLGTRHRAAVGMSENSDAVVLVVSEETGTISIAEGGTLTRDFNGTTLRGALKALLYEQEETKNTGIISKFRGFITRLREKRKPKEE